MRSKDYKRQINIAFFEHRNSDSICAIKWEQSTINSPTIDTMQTDEIYKDKWDISKTVDYGEVSEMANWIEKELIKFWIENKNSSKRRSKKYRRSTSRSRF